MAVEIDTEEQEEKVTPKTSSKKYIVIGGVAVLVIIAVLAVLWLYPMDSEGPSFSETSKNPTGAALGNAYYVVLPRPFIFNVPGQSRDRLVQISVQLMVRGGRNDDLARQNIPMIEGVLHRTFSSATAESLQTREGRMELRDAALNVVQNALEELTGSTVVEELLFTGFVMQ